MPVTITNGNAYFGIRIPLSSFHGYLQAFLKNDPNTPNIETLGAKLAVQNFPEAETKDFVKKVCEWGGYPGIGGRVLKGNSISDICEAFRDATSILSNTKSVTDALIRVNRLHALGSTSFASKHLRFLKPDLCGVYDSILNKVLPYSFDAAGYSEFCNDLSSVAQDLMAKGISNPTRQGGAWFAADVEAAIYAFVTQGDLGESISGASSVTRLSKQSQFRGCLLGGAVGDALGAPVEFMSYEEIVRRFGPKGIRDFAPAYGRLGAITDDTQMTLFTAEGLLRAYVRGCTKGVSDPPSVVHHAYLRWLKTQGENESRLDHDIDMNGWLANVEPLSSRREPGLTCLASLKEARHFGDQAQNDSKGCGAVMRTAPVGLVATPDEVWDIAWRVAELTHGHRSGICAAVFLSILLNEIVSGASLVDALRTTKAVVVEVPNGEVVEAVEQAERAASSGDTRAVVDGKLGAGWVAEEALSIALFCALVNRNFEEAIVMAANHGGDSDSTGSIAGNICGALYGVKSIPERWLKRLEMRDEISQIADDLLAMTEGTLDLESDVPWERKRYPGF
jgi:ADP-ribosylglycohydrolase